MSRIGTSGQLGVNLLTNRESSAATLGDNLTQIPNHAFPYTFDEIP